MTKNSTPFNIAIVGGGLGGLFTALALHHHCTNIHIDIYEQATQYKEIGAGVGLGVNAARLIHKLGLGEKLNAIAGDRQGVWITFRRFCDGGEVVTVPVEDRETVRQAPCARTELLDLLKGAVEERGAARLWTRKACARVEDLGDDNKGIQLHFTDTTTATADLVIASDGIHSTIRHQFQPDHPNFSGQIAYRAVIPLPLPNWPYKTYSVLWLAKHRHFLCFPISQNTALNIVAFVTTTKAEEPAVRESWTSVCDRGDIEKDFAGFEETVQEIIRRMPPQPSKWRLNDREPLDRWHYLHGKCVLLGDAAHAMLPHLGAGAGQSMEDGWVLARALSEYLTPGKKKENPYFASLESTAELYQRVRLPRAQKVQATSRAAGNTYEMQAEDMVDKSFEECCPMIAERTRERMKWVWEEDLDAAYEKVRDGS